MISLPILSYMIFLLEALVSRLGTWYVMYSFVKRPVWCFQIRDIQCIAVAVQYSFLLSTWTKQAAMGFLALFILFEFFAPFMNENELSCKLEKRNRDFATVARTKNDFSRPCRHCKKHPAHFSKNNGCSCLLHTKINFEVHSHKKMQFRAW